MAQIFTNNAISTLASPLGLSDTSMSIAPGTGSRWPAIVAPDFAFSTLEDAAGNIEIIKITAHAAGSTAFTIERAQQDTTARAYSIGDLVEMRLTRAEMTAWEADIDNLEATRARHAGQAYTGAHDFSGASGVTLPAATSIGPVSGAEIATLDGVTSSIQGQINAANSARSSGDADLEARKADINGETYAGTHDFTGATLRAQTKALGSSGTEVATVDYVNQAAFSASLPAQTGNAGKALFTDGANADWEEVLPAQTGNAGKALFTDGNAAFWEAPLPSLTGNAGKFLSNNGTAASWQDIPPPNQLPILALGII